MRDTDHMAALATLNSPLRRRVYDFAAGEPEGVSRDGAAEALGLSRSGVAFHLDKLADVGLLAVGYRRPPGRSGPGSGRPAKWYRRVDVEIDLSVPERRYTLAATLLAEAAGRATTDSVPMARALHSVARDHGRRVGERLRRTNRTVPPAVTCLAEVLAECGYQPRLTGDVLTLGNCPFQALADRHRDLVCVMNYELLRGLVEEAGLPAGSARLDPDPGRCCVTLSDAGQDPRLLRSAPAGLALAHHNWHVG